MDENKMFDTLENFFLAQFHEAIETWRTLQRTLMLLLAGALVLHSALFSGVFAVITSKELTQFEASMALTTLSFLALNSIYAMYRLEEYLQKRASRCVLIASFMEEYSESPFRLFRTLKDPDVMVWLLGMHGFYQVFGFLALIWAMIFVYAFFL